jgi:hypothetical protein
LSHKNLLPITEDHRWLSLSLSLSTAILAASAEIQKRRFAIFKRLVQKWFLIGIESWPEMGQWLQRLMRLVYGTLVEAKAHFHEGVWKMKV